MVTSGSLHTFSDASEEAYGAVSYIRYQYSSGAISLCFVAAKARVTPLSSISIPHLELMGAVMGLRLTTAISPVLDVEISQVVLWTDSMNVLWWIRNRSHKFKAFVVNRVGEIQSVTSPEQWRYVPIELNPADYVTRGLTASELVQKVTWWKGPSFLAKSKAERPKNRIEQTTLAEKEKKKGCRNSKEADLGEITMVSIDKTSNWYLDPKRFSSWQRLTRVQAWVYRFLDNRRMPEDFRISGELMPEEIEDTEIQIIKNAQREAFTDDYLALSHRHELPKSSKLIRLNPKLDDNGVL